MSLAPTALAAPRAPSPASAHMNFSSNNPFRRAVSPAPAPAAVAPAADYDNSRRKLSNNPFLDPPSKSASVKTTAIQSNPFGEDTFNGISLTDRAPSNNDSRLRRPAPAQRGLSSVSHRPSRSSAEEEEARRRHQARVQARANAPEQLDIFASPPKTESRRPRRNSESSVMDKDKMAEDDKRRRERRKEREARREKDGRSKDGKSSKPRRKPQGLDLIDQLDVTGVYGHGGLFHHDGPFDACNPHRNRKKDYRAPMQAFPTGSANNTIGGSGPVNAKIDFDKFHGRGAEGFNDYATSGGPDTRAAPKRQESFNPTEKIEQLHGEETHGLGTSTFLEGAPASRKALERRESESDQQQGSGLGRKKSLAIRLRGLSQPRRSNDPSNARITSPEARYNGSPESEIAVQSAGGPSRAKFAPGQESNPFFNEYDDAYEKKGTQIRIAESTNSGRARAPSSPRPVGLTRSVTAESNGYGTSVPEKTGGGFLNRMKSLKGGPRRARPDRTESSN